MIRSFRHQGLERFYETGSKAGIQPAHAPRLRRQLAVLDNLTTLGNWRLTFEFDGSDVHLVDYRDYH